MTGDEDVEPVGELVRSYVIANGRVLPTAEDFSVTTLVTATDRASQSRMLSPESRAIVDLCAGGFLSVAEVAGHVRQPLGIVRALLADLAESSLIHTRAPVAMAERTDIEILEDVLHGLRTRFA